MSYFLFFIVIALGLFNSFIDLKVLLLFDEDDEEDCFDELKYEISSAMLLLEQSLMIIVLKYLNYGALLIALYSILLWGSTFLFFYLFDKFVQNKNK